MNWEHACTLGYSQAARQAFESILTYNTFDFDEGCRVGCQSHDALFDTIHDLMKLIKNCVRSPRCNGNDTVCSGVSKPIDPKHRNPKSKVTIIKVINDDVSAVTLKRTDTTLDLSQKAKRFKERE